MSTSSNPETASTDPVSLLRDVPLPLGRAEATISEVTGRYLQVGGLQVHYRDGHVEAACGHAALSTRDARTEGHLYQTPDGRLGLIASRCRSRVIVLTGHCQVEVRPWADLRHATAIIHAPSGGAVIRQVADCADLPSLPLAIVGQGDYATEVR